MLQLLDRGRAGRFRAWALLQASRLMQRMPGHLTLRMGEQCVVERVPSGAASAVRTGCCRTGQRWLGLGERELGGAP